MRRIGWWWLHLLMVGACTTGGAPYPPNLLMSQMPFTDAPSLLAVEQALAVDAAGVAPQEALKPILALPEHCDHIRKTADEACVAPGGYYSNRWQVRGGALHTLVDARFDAGGARRPSEALTRLALAELTKDRDTAYIAANGFAKLGDRAAAERALVKSGITREQRDMRMGLWFNDLDLATHGALGNVIYAQVWVRFLVWDEIEAAVVAGERIDLQKQILLSRIDWYIDAENQALHAADRLVKLGEEGAVRAALEKAAALSSRPGYYSSAWVSFMGFLRLSDRKRAEEIAAPWLTREGGDWPCDKPLAARIFTFAGHPSYCNLGFHFREALETGDHPIP